MDKHSEKCSSFEERKDEQIASNKVESNFIANDSVPSYSEQEALALAERMNTNEAFEEAAQVLIHWLEKGECNEKNSKQFQHLLQLCWNRVDQLIKEQKEYQEQTETAEIRLMNKLSCFQLCLNEVGKIFQTIEKPDIWSNFTENQKKEMLKMKSDIEHFIKDYVSSEIEEKVSLKEENVNFEAKKPENVVGQFEDKKKRHKEYKDEILTPRSNLKKRKIPIKYEKNNAVEDSDNQQKLPHVDVASQCDAPNEKFIISLVSTILFDHPNGKHITHLNEYISQYNATEIENVLRKNSEIFEESRDTQDIKWVLCNSFRENLVNITKKL